MSIIKEGGGQVFDLEAVRRGDLIRAQYVKSGEARNGAVFKAEAGRLTVQFQPETPNVSAFFYIYPAEVGRGEWRMTWTRDFTEVWQEGGGGA